LLVISLFRLSILAEPQGPVPSPSTTLSATHLSESGFSEPREVIIFSAGMISSFCSTSDNCRPHCIASHWKHFHLTFSFVDFSSSISRAQGLSEIFHHLSFSRGGREGKKRISLVLSVNNILEIPWASWIGRIHTCIHAYIVHLHINICTLTCVVTIYRFLKTCLSPPCLTHF
jgi:hypothetical protein